MAQLQELRAIESFFFKSPEKSGCARFLKANCRFARPLVSMAERYFGRCFLLPLMREPSLPSFVHVVLKVGTHCLMILKVNQEETTYLEGYPISTNTHGRMIALAVCWLAQKVRCHVGL